MATRYFQVADDRPSLYKNKWTLGTGVTTAYNGTALEMGSDGTLGVSNAAADTVFGLLWEPTFPIAQWPTVDTAADEVNIAAHYAGRKVNVVSGRFMALVGKQLFAQTAFPTNIGDTVYNFGDGRLSNTDTGSATALGKYLGSVNLHNSLSPESGQTYETVGVVEFNF